MQRKAPKLFENPRERLPRGLYVLTPETDDDDWLVAAVTAAIRGGASAVQYRSKQLGAAERLRQARTLRGACRRLKATFIVNDSPELARDLEADGVHLGRDDADPAAVRASNAHSRRATRPTTTRSAACSPPP